MNTRTETPPVTTLLAWTDALNRHDADAAAADFAPDAYLTNARTGTHAQGRDAIREEFKSYFAMFTDWAVEIDEDAQRRHLVRRGMGDDRSPHR